MSAVAVAVAADGDVLVVTIDRPEARNAVNAAVAQGIAAALDRLDADDDLRAGILTGAGGSFCAGMDLKAFVAGERPHVEGRGFAGIVQGPPRKPLIAAGGGLRDPIGAERAHAIGIVSRLAEPGQALAAARELAREIARNAPLALDATKRIVAAAPDWTEEEAWRRQGDIAGPVFASEDAREGATAFAEKRDPVWKGR